MGACLRTDNIGFEYTDNNQADLARLAYRRPALYQPTARVQISSRQPLSMSRRTRVCWLVGWWWPQSRFMQGTMHTFSPIQRRVNSIKLKIRQITRKQTHEPQDVAITKDNCTRIADVSAEICINVYNIVRCLSKRARIGGLDVLESRLMLYHL